jgi:hypothetical protein
MGFTHTNDIALTLRYKKFKTILPLCYLEKTWTFLISNYSRSNFASSHVELNSNKANKKKSKEINTIRRVCDKTVEGGCCGGP